MAQTKKDVLYICDPEKNVGCPKSSCIHNPNAKYHGCESVLDSRFAMLDRKGRPIVNRRAMRVIYPPLWHKIAKEIRYGFYCVRRELFNFLNRFRG